jgi:urease accessory protein
MIAVHRVFRADNRRATTTVTLTYALRCKSRQPLLLDNGERVLLALPRGTVLRAGDLLQDDNDRLIAVHAAREALSVATTENAQLLARACYHLGNRHVPLAISEHQVSFLQDHILDALLTGLGLSLRHDHLPFEPEAGAFLSHDHPA